MTQDPLLRELAQVTGRSTTGRLTRVFQQHLQAVDDEQVEQLRLEMDRILEERIREALGR